MENEIKKAKIKATGEEIRVYKLKSGGWCNYEDCKTVYQEDELEWI